MNVLLNVFYPDNDTQMLPLLRPIRYTYLYLTIIIIIASTRNIGNLYKSVTFTSSKKVAKRAHKFLEPIVKMIFHFDPACYHIVMRPEVDPLSRDCHH